MRFMMLMILKGYEKAQPGALPSAELVAAMTKYNQALTKAGVLLALDGLHPTSAGARISFSGGRPSIKDGPFPEAREVVGGYWLIQVKSRAERVGLALPRTGRGRDRGAAGPGAVGLPARGPEGDAGDLNDKYGMNWMLNFDKNAKP